MGEKNLFCGSFFFGSSTSTLILFFFFSSQIKNTTDKRTIMGEQKSYNERVEKTKKMLRTHQKSFGETKGKVRCIITR